MGSQFGEGAAGAALELRLTRFAGAIVEQAKPKPPIQSLPRAIGSLAGHNAGEKTTIGISNHRRGLPMGLILLIILIVLLMGGLPTWGYSRSWGYGPSGGLGLVLVVVLVLIFMGHIPRGF